MGCKLGGSKLRFCIGLFSILYAFCAPALAAETERSGYRLVANWPAQSVVADLGQATGISVDSHNHVFVFHRANREWIEPFPDEPIAAHTVLMLDAETGEALASWGGNLMIMPHGLSVDADDNVWVTDVGGQQVHKFSHDGQLLMSLGTAQEAGNDGTHFAQPADVTVDRFGRILVADGYVNTRIAVFTAEGNYLGQWGTHGDGPSQFDLPHGISLGPNQEVFVADRANSRLQIFGADHEYLDVWAGDHIGRPYGVDVDAEGVVYVIDGGDQPDNTRATIRMLDMEGRLLGSIDTMRSDDAAGTVLGHDISVASDGSIYVVDAWARRIVKYTRAHP